MVVRAGGGAHKPMLGNKLVSNFVVKGVLLPDITWTMEYREKSTF